MSDTLLTVKAVNESVLQLKETSSLLPSKKQFVYQLISTTGTIRDVLSVPVQDFIIPAEMSSQELLERRRHQAKNLYHSIHEYFYLLNTRLPRGYESYASYQADNVKEILEFVTHGHLYHYEVSQWGQEFYYFNDFDVDAIPEDVRFYLDGVNEGENHIILHVGNMDTRMDLVLSVAPVSNKYMDWIYSVERRATTYKELHPLIAGHIKMTMTPDSIYHNYQSWDFRDTKTKLY